MTHLPHSLYIVGKVFTCSHSSTQRGESINSLIKEKGQKNKELRKYNLYELALFLSNKISRIEETSLIEICELIEKGRLWSRYVHDQWNAQCKKCHQLPFVQQVSPETWNAASQENCTNPHIITLNDLAIFGVPSCTCRAFTSSLIPCAGICAVFSRMTNELFDITNLHPRWRLKNHPLYETALKKKKLVVEPTSCTVSAQSGSRNLHSHQLTLEAYSNIICPTKADVRYVKLNQQFKKIEPAACRDAHTYKLLMMNLIAFEQSLSNSDPAGFVLNVESNTDVIDPFRAETSTGAQPLPILPPVSKKRQRNDDGNRSALKRNRGKCKECIANGEVPSDNHRSYSKRCPFFTKK
jgi:hypothetical protein